MRKANLFSLVLIAIPFVIFSLFLYTYCTNVPILDDYGLVLNFVNSFLKAQTLTEKLGAIFLQHTDHRVVLEKLLILAQLALKGQVDFRQLSILTGIVYEVFVAIFIVWARNKGFDWLQIIPIPFILLTFTHIESMFFFSASVFYWGALFSLLFFITIQDEKSILFHCVLYPLAIFSFGGGLVFYPLINAYLLLHKKWKQAALFFGSSTIFTLLYYYHYTFILQHPPLRSVFVHLDRSLEFFFSFLGNSVPSHNLALLTGIVAFILLVIITIESFKTDSFLFLASTWSLASAMIITLARSGFGVEEAFQSRYATYSLISWSIIYVAGIQYLRSKYLHLFTTCVIVSSALSMALFCGILVQYQFNNSFERNRDMKIAGLNILAKQNNDGYLIYPDRGFAKKVLRESKQLGVYNYRKVAELLLQRINLQSTLPVANSAFEGYIDQNDGVHISGWAIIPYVQSSNSKVYLLLRKDQYTIKIDTLMIERPDISQSHNIGYGYDYSGYEAYLAAYAIHPGLYDLGVMVQNGTHTAIQWQSEPLQIK